MSKAEFDKTKMYPNSKLSSLLYSRRLANQLADERRPITISLVSPGIVFTDITRHQRFIYLKYALLFLPLGPFVRTARQGAQTVLHCSMNATLAQSGVYFRNCSPGKFAAAGERKDWMDLVWVLTKRAIGKN